jgi:hypothetical protein
MSAAQGLARREAQKALTKLAREFVNQYLRHRPVTNEDRMNMGVPVPSETRTEIGRAHV